MNYHFYTSAKNFLICFDKYSKTYNKNKQPKNKYQQFYFLDGSENQLKIIDKVQNYLSCNNDFIIKVNVNTEKAIANIKGNGGTETGVGYFINESTIRVDSIIKVKKINGKIIEEAISIEEALSKAYLINADELISYQNLKPRSVSVLPVAIECQAKCKFCFSKSSISLNKRVGIEYEHKLRDYCKKGLALGAERFVITGGGEPLLYGYDGICDIIKIANEYFSNILLITNGKEIENYSEKQLNNMAKLGLKRIAISVHSYNLEKNNDIMNLKVDYKHIIKKIKKAGIKVRLICVIQKNGVANEEDIINYIKFSLELKVFEICFKELYVSTKVESDYYNSKANQYSKDNQVDLSIVKNTMNKLGAKIKNTLPWGAEIYSLPLHKLSSDVMFIDVAAYTEPSVGWERTNGIARSWNITKDGQCYASLEDNKSIIN